MDEKELHQRTYDKILRRIKELSDDSEKTARHTVYTSVGISIIATMIIAPNLDGLFKTNPLNIAIVIAVLLGYVLMIRTLVHGVEDDVGNNIVEIIELQSDLEKLLQKVQSNAQSKDNKAR